MRPYRFRVRIALVAAVAGAAGPVLAQAPVERPATHTVKKGDTLWDLGQQYLGDPFQWPQIYRLNTDLIKDPHWIYPGQVFKLPGGSMGTAEVTAPPSPGTGQAPGGAARRGSPTVFNSVYGHVEAKARASAQLSAPHTAVRTGDYEAAPYMWTDGGPADGGELEGTAEPTGVTMTLNLRPIQFREQVFVTLPRGAPLEVGRKLVVYRMDASVPGQGQVVVPTGELRVVAFLDGRRARADLIAKFEDVYAGQRVTMLDPLVMPMNVFPTRVEFGISTHVAWLYANPRLAGMRAAIILTASAAQGLAPGDQVTLKRPRSGDAAANMPDEELAVAQVTRVTPWGASALLLTVRDAGITAGMRAQVTAKMP